MTDDTTTPQRDGTADHFSDVLIGRHTATIRLVKYFAWAHLPERLQAVSAPAGHVALDMINKLPDGPELTAGLKKLLEAKDWFVRAAL